MDAIPDGYYFCIDYDRYTVKSDGDTLYEPAGSIRLSISKRSKAYEIVNYDIYDNYDVYPLSEEELVQLKQYMIDPPEIDLGNYEYCLAICAEDWLQEKLEKEDDERIKKWMEGLPDPKIILALVVLEKGEDQGDGYEMPLYGIDINEVRAFFDLPEPQDFGRETRLDQRMYDFISKRIKCNNIQMDKYDYRPIIRYNAYPEFDDVVVVPSHIEKGEGPR